MDTVKDIIDWALEPQGQDRYVQWSVSTAGFSGDSASVERAVALVCFPIGLAGMAGTTFRAGVIGGDASKCPGLLPLHSLITAATIALGCFPNGDGLFAFRDGRSGKACPQRVYKTDSGHYLLSIDQFGKPVGRELETFLHRHVQCRIGRSPSNESRLQSKSPGKRQSAGQPGHTFAVWTVPEDATNTLGPRWTPTGEFVSNQSE